MVFFWGGEGARTLSNEGGVVKDCIPGYKILGGGSGIEIQGGP